MADSDSSAADAIAKHLGGAVHSSAQRSFVVQRLLQGKTIADISVAWSQNYAGETVPSRRTMYRWVNQFKRGQASDARHRLSTEPGPRSRPQVARHLVKELFEGDKKLSAEEISKVLHMSQSSVQRIIRQEDKSNKVPGRTNRTSYRATHKRLEVDQIAAQLQQAGGVDAIQGPEIIRKNEPGVPKRRKMAPREDVSVAFGRADSVETPFAEDSCDAGQCASTSSSYAFHHFAGPVASHGANGNLQSPSHQTNGAGASWQQTRDFEDEHQEMVHNFVQNCVPSLDGGDESLACQNGANLVIVGGIAGRAASNLYFIALAALRTGAASVHVLCGDKVAQKIELASISQSVDIHVTACLPDDIVITDCNPSLGDAAHEILALADAIIFGPGLTPPCGQPQNSEIITQMLLPVVQTAVPIIFSGDASILLLSLSEILMNSDVPCTILPTERNIRTLHDALMQKQGLESDSESIRQVCDTVARAYDGITIVVQGSSDFVTNGETEYTCSSGGSLKRCGGLNEILSGCSALFAAWARKFTIKNGCDSGSDASFNVMAAYTASLITRCCAEMAFTQKGRSLITMDLIQYMPEVVNNLLDACV